MYTQKYYYILLIVFSISASSCRKYVELEPQGKIIPSTVNDYQLLLNNSGVFNLSYGSVDYPTDDIALLNDDFINSFDVRSLQIYKWADLFYQANEDDPEWNLFYKQVYNANVAIQGLPEAKSGDANLKTQLIAEAKVHRAYAYLCLVNLYAKEYHASSAATDLGVPLLTEPGYTQSLKRATVKAVYDLILSDLNAGVETLPSLSTSKTAPSKSAAYALLARTYLYMGEYQKALDNANLSLGIQSALFNLNPYVNMGAGSGYPDGFFLPTSQDNPEVIWMKASSDGGGNFPLSDELITLLGTKDLRTHFFTYYVGPDGDPIGIFNYPGTYHTYFAPFETVPGSTQIGPTVPEMMLIKAECLARTQKGQAGLTVVNELRKFRFKPAEYTSLTAANDDAALLLILQERRRELFCKGFRLFDLKRFNTDPKLAKTITHPLKTQQLTLVPGSNRYVYPIPTKVINANQEIDQNPR
ncbi:RagB/SusD family nutrient uptake outer membrane protein [Pedobacter hiemivivus]|uniref:RagB/SusD family nutrient uptake outer membrane protein n=1 Tax=Pedobacter hiemivivus TaxID=2530454 RepID=A0A4R0NGP8_9SPHI|nr:RagB/SusD family nutrient uptake outer membrane protein [Pedobacter hiemivivus]TCC99348.1 RagB/SusD family nutrient uptake outer membrane protein [Pedobacter hiemivivus]